MMSLMKRFKEPLSIEQVLVVVDVTPLQTCDGDGGAKWFVLSLLGELVRQRPDWCWLLLTSATNDHLLAELYPTIERLRITDESGVTSRKVLLAA